RDLDRDRRTALRPGLSAQSGTGAAFDGGRVLPRRRGDLTHCARLQRSDHGGDDDRDGVDAAVPGDRFVPLPLRPPPPRRAAAALYRPRFRHRLRGDRHRPVVRERLRPRSRCYVERSDQAKTKLRATNVPKERSGAIAAAAMAMMPKVRPRAVTAETMPMMMAVIPTPAQ